MQFIVVGGAGFIGSHVVEALLRQHHRVIVVDNFLSGRRENLPRNNQVSLVSKDVLECTNDDFHGIPGQINGIVHLAAIPSVQASWNVPVSAHSNNLSTTVAILHLCKQLSIPRMVFASSAAVYGEQCILPISEEQPPNPMMPYGLQKWMSEEYMRLFAPKIGLSAIALRIFNVFGPRQSPNSPYSGVISIFTDRVQGGEPITIYGDGLQSRDFIYVEDVARAFAKALTVSLPDGEFRVCNLGTGRRTTLLELLQLLQDMYPDWQGELRYAPERHGDIKHSQADISRLRAILDFEPSWTMGEGLKRLLHTYS